MKHKFRNCVETYCAKSMCSSFPDCDFEGLFSKDSGTVFVRTKGRLPKSSQPPVVSLLSTVVHASRDHSNTRPFNLFHDETKYIKRDLARHYIVLVVRI